MTDNEPESNSQIIQDNDNIPQSEGSTLNTKDVLALLGADITGSLGASTWKHKHGLMPPK